LAAIREDDAMQMFWSLTAIASLLAMIFIVTRP